MSDKLFPFEEEKLSCAKLNGIVSSAKKKAGIKRHIRLVPMAAAIAAALTCSVAAYGVYVETEKARTYGSISSKDSVLNYYDSYAVWHIENFYDMSNLVSSAVSENEHFRVTMETLLTDDISLNTVLTVEALDEAAEEYLCTEDEYGPYLLFLPFAYAYDNDGNEITVMSSGYSFGFGTVETYNCKSIEVNVALNKLEGAEEIDIKLYERFLMEDTDTSADMFDGIEFKVKTLPNVESVRFTANTDWEVCLSPFAFHIIKAPCAKEDNPEKFIIYYKDGTSKEYWIGGFGEEYYDIKNAVSVEYGKTLYYPDKLTNDKL